MPARVAFAVRCPQCGQLETSIVSLFEFSGGSTVRLTCTCGAHKLTVGMRKGGPYWLQVPCYLCDGVHFTYYSPQEFWDPNLKRVLCNDSELQLGVFGGEGEVQASTPADDVEVDKILEDAIMEDYFDDPEVMYQALSHVHDLAEAGELTCQCGNPKVEVDIFSDRLELTCSECGGRRELYASNAADLERLHAFKTLQVSRGDRPARESREQPQSKARHSKSVRRKK